MEPRSDPVQRQRAETRLSNLRQVVHLVSLTQAAEIAADCGMACLTAKWWDGQCRNHHLRHHTVGKGRWIDMNVVLDVIEGVIRKTALVGETRHDIDRVIHHGALLRQRMRQKAGQ
jgi:hypothetical protein